MKATHRPLGGSANSLTDASAVSRPVERKRTRSAPVADGAPAADCAFPDAGVKPRNTPPATGENSNRVTPSKRWVVPSARSASDTAVGTGFFCSVKRRALSLGTPTSKATHRESSEKATRVARLLNRRSPPPHFCDSAYANHLPSFDIAGDWMLRQARASPSVIGRPPFKGGCWAASRPPVAISRQNGVLRAARVGEYGMYRIKGLEGVWGKCDEEPREA